MASAAITGTLLCGVFATAAVSISPEVPAGYAGLLEGNGGQVSDRSSMALPSPLAWSGVVTAVLLKLVALLVPLRVSKEAEMEGLDISLHGEALQ